MINLDEPSLGDDSNEKPPETNQAEAISSAPVESTEEVSAPAPELSEPVAEESNPSASPEAAPVAPEESPEEVSVPTPEVSEPTAEQTPAASPDAAPEESPEEVSVPAPELSEPAAEQPAETEPSTPVSPPYADLSKLPLPLFGPYLRESLGKSLASRTEISPAPVKPDELLSALFKTMDLMQPCDDSNCSHEKFIYDKSTKPTCPFCNKVYSQKLPVLTFYDPVGSDGKYAPADHQLTVYSGQNLYLWHIDPSILPSQKLTEEQESPLASFKCEEGQWKLLNINLPELQDADSKDKIGLNESIELTENRKILLAGGGRLALVQVANA